MLSSTSPAQKILSEEDGSGSDAGSEVGLEPETDRFGFILTNGSTAGSVGPPPELVRQRETKWINIISQWDRILLKKTSKVKVQCQKGIPASLRAKCWPLLCGATDTMNRNKNLYQSLDSQPALQSWVDVIERDLDRQFPFHEMFLSKDGHGQRGLFRVLKAYTQYQPEEGYCQAQGPVAAVLLMNMPAEEAFWCLVQISEQYLPGYYSPLLEGVLFDAAMLNWVLKRTCPAAHKHLQHHGVEPLMFATDWLMCLFTRHLPFNTLLRVWDLFFCYGVRVLLQVAAVLVRRVLGRAEQRKLCQGQMETLERLRGVKEQVQEEDDAFIAEVCSLQLSARDLEKQMEKELEKWRKDRPSSTFDPRGRCQGYRMAWARIRQKEEERDRKEREKGNLSVPLARSASTLSLSPSLIHKRWRKGGKASTREREGGGKIVRHLSMGAKDDWSSWTELNFKKVQGVQEEEDVVLGEHKKQSEPKQTGQTEQKELLEEPQKTEIQNMPIEHVEEQSEQAETIIIEKEESHPKETEGSNVLSEQTEETNVEKEQTEDLTVENILQPAEVKQGEELDSYSQSQVPEQQSHESEHLEMEVKETNKETERQVSESELTAAAEGNQNEIQKDAVADENTDTQESVDQSSNTEEQVIQDDMKAKESTETEYVQQTQVDTTETSSETEKQVSESEHAAAAEGNQNEIQKDAVADENTEGETQESVDPSSNTEEQVIQDDMKAKESTETEYVQQTQVDMTETSSETDSRVECPTVKDPTEERQTQQQQQEVITETDTQGDAFEGKHHSTESLARADMKEESRTLTETESTETEYVQQTQADTTETSSETDSQVEGHSVKDPTSETQTQQQEVITETDTQGDAFEGKHHSTESLARADMKEESRTLTETETDELTQTQERVEENAATQELEAEIVKTDSGAETLILCSPERIQPKEGTDLAADTDTEAEIPVANDILTESSEAFEKECDAVPEPTQEEEERRLTAHSEAQVDSDRTQAVETPTETETTDTTAPLRELATSTTPAEAANLTAEPDGKRSSVETSTSEEPAPARPTSQVTMGAVEEEEAVQEKTVEEHDVFVSTEPTDSPNTDSNPQDQGKEEQAERDNSALTQVSGLLGSRTSGDCCVRKSANSRESRLARRLSEDLFTMPEKNSQSQSTSNLPEVKHSESQSSPGAVNPTQAPPDVTERTAVQQEQPPPPPDPPKRFSLFHRLRGEQTKKAKGKPKMQVPKILIQDFSDGTGTGKPVEEEGEEKLSSRERRRQRRERERREKEEERSRKKREKELGKEKERERRKPQTRGKSFQVQGEKRSSDASQPAKTGSQTLRHSASFAQSYF